MEVDAPPGFESKAKELMLASIKQENKSTPAIAISNSSPTQTLQLFPLSPTPTVRTQGGLSGVASSSLKPNVNGRKNYRPKRGNPKCKNNPNRHQHSVDLSLLSDTFALPNPTECHPSLNQVHEQRSEDDNGATNWTPSIPSSLGKRTGLLQQHFRYICKTSMCG